MKTLRLALADWLDALEWWVRGRTKPGPKKGARKPQPDQIVGTAQFATPVVDAESTPKEGGAT